MILLPQYPDRVLALLSQASEVSPTTTVNTPIAITQASGMTTKNSVTSGDTYILASKTMESTITPIKQSTKVGTYVKQTASPTPVTVKKAVSNVSTAVSTTTKKIIQKAQTVTQFKLNTQSIVLLSSFGLLLSIMTALLVVIRKK